MSLETLMSLDFWMGVLLFGWASCSFSRSFSLSTSLSTGASAKAPAHAWALRPVGPALTAQLERTAQLVLGPRSQAELS